MKIIQCEQQSPEWFASRLGIPSASNFDKIVTNKGEPSKQLQKYLYRLAGEIISGTCEETYQNEAMKRGVILEEEARNLYKLVKDTEVEQVGFCVTDNGVIYGCSPDGLVGKKGLIEIKCPLMANHVQYLYENVLPTDYFQQVQGELLVTEREWCDFISYYPALPPLIIRVERDEKFINDLKRHLGIFCSLLNEVVKKIKDKKL